MATVVVERGKGPARLACDRCGCEIHALGDRDLLARHPPNSGFVNGGRYVVAYFREREPDERPVYHPDDCDCRCHESARRFLANKYE